MADAYLNNDISSLVKTAYGQLVGEDDIDTLDLADFCETGKAYDNLIANNAWKEQFTKALLQQCVKNFYTDTSYREEYRDPFFKDSRRFGALCQMISAELPDSAIQESKAWQHSHPDHLRWACIHSISRAFRRKCLERVEVSRSTLP